MPTTIRDVAAAAGVSPATVSRVLNGREDVAVDLRERVKAAVESLGYRPNGLARSLRTRATTVLGVIIADITNPFFTSMVRGVEDAAQEAGYSVVLANTDEDLDKERRYLEVAAAEQMAGVVLCPASSSTSIEVLAERKIPVATIDRRLNSNRVDSVTVDNFRAAFQATEHLIEQGCRRIGFVAGPAITTTGERRLAGYRAALDAGGLGQDPDLVVQADFRIDGGRAAAGQLLSVGLLDALFVSNNLMTIGALEAVRERGLQVPTDIAMVGFDDTSWATALQPPLTAVTQPTYDIGRKTATLLLRRIRGEDFSPQHVVLPTQLVVRASSLRKGL